MSAEKPTMNASHELLSTEQKKENKIYRMVDMNCPGAPADLDKITQIVKQNRFDIPDIHQDPEFPKDMPPDEVRRFITTPIEGGWDTIVKQEREKRKYSVRYVDPEQNVLSVLDKPINIQQNYYENGTIIPECPYVCVGVDGAVECGAIPPAEIKDPSLPAPEQHKDTRQYVLARGSFLVYDDPDDIISYEGVGLLTPAGEENEPVKAILVAVKKISSEERKDYILSKMWRLLEEKREHDDVEPIGREEAREWVIQTETGYEGDRYFRTNQAYVDLIEGIDSTIIPPPEPPKLQIRPLCIKASIYQTEE